MLEKEIGQLLAAGGACDWAFAQVGDGPAGLPRLVSVVVRLSDAIVDEIEEAPTHTYFHHYRTVNALLDQLTLGVGLLLASHGWRYVTVAASQSININGSPYEGRYSHKKAAGLAGLGTVGKSDLFLHRRFGPRVRLATLFTDCPLEAGEPAAPVDSCGSCRLCVEACPAGAITGAHFGSGAPLLDPALCSAHMKRAYQLIGRGAVCGICMRVCPKGLELR